MPQELTESDIFVLLSDRWRRLVLRLLQESTTSLTAMELAERIGEREYENPSERQRRTVYLALYHNHLPRLENADVIVYDETEGTVAPALNFDRLVGHLIGANDWGRSPSDE